MNARLEPIAKSSVKGECSPEEWQLRVQLAAAYRIVDYYGWTELIYGHLTMRVPGPERHFLINPYGLGYDEVTASNLVKIDLDGNIIGRSDYPINLAGFVIHSAIHAAREDAHCVMHTHTRAGMALAACSAGLLPISMTSTAFHERVAYHVYEGVSVEIDERERLARDLGKQNAMILVNHGILTCGHTIPEAFLRLYRLERAAQVQLDAQAMNHPLSLLPDDVARKSGEQLDGFGREARSGKFGELEFAYLMRKMDRIDASYRE
jgi:ribulose-5-phosphate 4-epimerase/fuculose-1-phosphate aldolase